MRLKQIIIGLVLVAVAVVTFIKVREYFEKHRKDEEEEEEKEPKKKKQKPAENEAEAKKESEGEVKAQLKQYIQRSFDEKATKLVAEESKNKSMAFVQRTKERASASLQLAKGAVDKEPVEDLDPDIVVDKAIARLEKEIKSDSDKPPGPPERSKSLATKLSLVPE